MLICAQYGWMADFGEYLPFDASLNTSAASAAQVHNLYPQLWELLNSIAIKNNACCSRIFF